MVRKTRRSRVPKPKEELLLRPDRRFKKVLFKVSASVRKDLDNEKQHRRGSASIDRILRTIVK